MFHIFPTNFVYWEKIENHEEIKKKYFKIIEDDLSKNEEKFNKEFDWNCKCKTSFFSRTDGFELFGDDFIKSVIWNPMDNMLEELNKQIHLPIPKNSNIFDIWYNRYEAGDWQETHDHKIGSDSLKYSGIYILDLNEKNTTSFFDTKKIECWNMKESLQTFHTYKTDILEGFVLLFPSELLHYVNPCKDTRTTISFNIISTF